MPSIDLGGQRIAWRDDGQGPALFLLSANPGDGRDFDAVTPTLAQQFRVIRPDWPGYGDSPAANPLEKTSPLYYCEVFHDLVDALQISTCHIIGNSIGGNVATRYAIEHPERVTSLVLVSAGGFTTHNPATHLFCRLMGMPGFNRAIRGLFSRLSYPVDNQWTRAIIDRALHEHASATATAVNAANWRGFADPKHDLRLAAREVKAPTLVINGRRDRVIPANSDGRAAAATIPGARMLIPDCGHAPFAELPAWFLDNVSTFWNSLLSPIESDPAGNLRRAQA